MAFLLPFGERGCLRRRLKVTTHGQISKSRRERRLRRSETPILARLSGCDLDGLSQSRAPAVALKDSTTTTIMPRLVALLLAAAATAASAESVPRVLSRANASVVDEE